MREHHEKNQRLLSRSTILLLFGCIIVLLIVSIIKYAVFQVELRDILNDVVSEIPGTLISIIVFNIAYEYLTRKEAEEELSENLAEVILGDSKVIQSFSKEQKLRYLHALMGSLTGSDKRDILFEMIQPELEDQALNYRKNFLYHIRIENPDPEMRHWFKNDMEDYVQIWEFLRYERHCSDGFPSGEVCLGFFIDEKGLAEGFADRNYVFRETLIIEPKLLDIIKNLDEAKRIEFMEICMDLTFSLDGRERKIRGVEAAPNGLLVRYDAADIRDDYEVIVTFKMPQLKNQYIIVVISEFTYSPQIWFEYQQKDIRVQAYEFLDKEPRQIGDEATRDGHIKLNPDGWVYPVRGAVFEIFSKKAEKKSEEDTDSGHTADAKPDGNADPERGEIFELISKELPGQQKQDG